jgi:hypothetical protein
MSEFLEAVSSGTITPELLQVRHLTCLQCCASGSTWIRIKLNAGTGSASKCHIRIKVIRKLDPDPHQFADDKLKCMVLSLFEHFFKGLSLYFEARIRIRIRIEVKGRIRIRMSIKVKSRIRIRIRVPSRIRIRIRIKVISRIGIRINLMRISNTA